MTSERRLDLPEVVAAFVRATNAGQRDAVVATFADGALVNDQLREYWDTQQIAEWVDREVIGQRLTMEVRRVVKNHEHIVVIARVDGEFEKRGLPDPLLVTFYFSTHEDKLVQLVILRNEP